MMGIQPISGAEGKQPAKVGDAGTRADVVKALILRISWQIPVWVLVSFALAVALIYFLQTRPIVEAESQRLEAASLQQVVNKTENLTGQIERLLLTAEQWANEGTLVLDDIEGFNRVMIPVLAQQSLVSSVHIAQESGRELLLLKAANGVWRNRQTDVPARANQQRWVEWSGARVKLAEEMKTQDYDPRNRPWFKEAMRGKPGDISWTQPYVFQTTQEPGISVSVRWLHPKTGESQVVAFDVLLTDLSDFTRSLVHARSGHVALMTMDGKVLGLPRHPAIRSAEEVKKSVLKEPSTIGLDTLAAAVVRWRDGGAQATAAFSLDVAGQVWRTSARTLPVRNIQFLVVAMAPEADFSPWSPRMLAVFGLLLAGELAFTFALSRHIRTKIHRPVRTMVDDLARLNSDLAAEAKASALKAGLVVKIQAVQTFPELATAFLSGLSAVLKVGQASFYRVDASNPRLIYCGGYAGDSTLGAPAEVNFGEGLVGQAAVEQRAILLNDPPADYCKVRSGLGDMPARTLLIEPIISNQRLRGIFEIAFTSELTDAELRFIEGLLPTLAMAMEIIERHEPYPQDL